MGRRKQKTDYGQKVKVTELEPGHHVMLGGAWRAVVHVEPHELDAYLAIHTLDGKRWVRGVFGDVRVREVTS